MDKIDEEEDAVHTLTCQMFPDSDVSVEHSVLRYSHNCMKYRHTHESLISLQETVHYQFSKLSQLLVCSRYKMQFIKIKCSL